MRTIGIPDFLAARPSSPVSRLVSRPAIGVGRWVSMGEAADQMRRDGISALVVDGGAAIVTERDIARGIGAGAHPTEPVIIVSTPHPMSVDGSMTIIECGSLMLEEEVRHLLVHMPEGYLGVVSQREVLATLVRDAHPARWYVGGLPSETWLG